MIRRPSRLLRIRSTASLGLFPVLFATGFGLCLARPAGGAEAVQQPLGRLDSPAGLALAFSPDGSMILTAGERVARVWDARTGQPVTGRLHQRSDLAAATFVDGGRAVFTAAGTEVRLWDVRTSKPRVEPVGLWTGVSGGVVSPDGLRFAVGGGAFDDAVLVFDTTTGKKVLSLKQQDSGLEHVAFSAGGGQLLTVERDYGATKSLSHKLENPRVFRGNNRGKTALWDRL